MSQNSDTPNSKIENATGVRDSKLKKALEKKADKPTKAEINGPKGLEPTRYGDWESKGRCYDF